MNVSSARRRRLSARLSTALWLAVSAMVAICSLSVADSSGSATPNVPCGVDAVVGSLHILDKPVDQTAVGDLSTFYQSPKSMSLLDVSQVLQTLAGCKAKAWELSYTELQSLDQPFVVHLTGSGCSECPGGGHVIAVERLAGEWAIQDGVAGASLQSSRLLQDSFGGHAVLFSAPFTGSSVGPRLTVDSYVSDLGPVSAGQRHPCRITIRNAGTEPLTGLKVECDPGLSCLEAPAQLTPGEAGEIALALHPAHRLDMPFDTRTYFLRIRSNDAVRPRTSAALRCTSVDSVVTQSPIVYFPRVRPGNSATRTVTVECRPPVELLGATGATPAVSAEVRETGRSVSGIRYAVEITARGDGLSPGLVEVPVRLTLKGADSAGAELTARLRVSSPSE